MKKNEETLGLINLIESLWGAGKISFKYSHLSLQETLVFHSMPKRVDESTALVLLRLSSAYHRLQAHPSQQVGYSLPLRQADKRPILLKGGLPPG